MFVVFVFKMFAISMLYIYIIFLLLLILNVNVNVYDLMAFILHIEMFVLVTIINH